MTWQEPMLPGIPVDYDILDDITGCVISSYHYIGNGEYVKSK